jgi:hypothetical protein
MTNLTRRSFLGSITTGLTSLRNMTSLLSGSLAFACQSAAAQLRRVLGRQVEYQIETHLGKIVIYSSRALPEGSLNDTLMREVTLEIPAPILAHFEHDPTLSGPHIDQRLAIVKSDLIISGAELKKGKIRPTRQMKIQMPASQWFALGTDVTPLFLTFQPDELIITLSQDPLSNLNYVYTQWPLFNLHVRTISAIGESKTLGRNLRFIPKGSSLVANGLGRSLETAEVKVFKTAMGEDTGLVLPVGSPLLELRWDLEHLSLSLELSDLAPIVRTHGEKKFDVQLTVPVLSITQFFTGVVRLGSFEPTIYGFPPSHIESFGPSCLFELNGLNHNAGDNPLWRLMPAGAAVPPLEAVIQVRPNAEHDLLHRGSRLTRAVFGVKKQKGTEWRHTQELSSFHVRLRGLGTLGLKDPVLRFDAATSHVSRDSTGHAEFKTCEGSPIEGKYLKVGDYCLRVRQVDESHFSWTESPQSGVAVSLRFVFDLAGAVWPGHLDLRAKQLDGWLHLDRTDGTSYLDPSRDDLTDFRGKDFEVHGQVIWSLANGTHDWTLVDPGAVTQPRRFLPLLTSLTQQNFRSSLEPDFPNSNARKLLLPPFSLREHPKKVTAADFEFVDPNKPGFESLNMWEPFVQTSVRATHSITKTFSEFAKSLDSLPVSFANAGLLAKGTFVRPDQTTWAAQKQIAGLAPFRPIRVTSLTATDAEDLVAPDQNNLRDGLMKGLNDEHRTEIEDSISRVSVPVSVSPMGGSISFDWAIEHSNTLSALGLHTYLHRYQENYAVEQRLLGPWGLQIEITTKLFRDEEGLIRYCQLWRFIQDEQTYGTSYPVKIFALRPLNPTTWREGTPFLFKADFELRSDRQPIYKRDVNLQGHAFPFYQAGGSATPESISAVVAFDDLSSTTSPTTIFDETTIVLKNITWSGSSASANTDAAIKVTAAGEVLHPEGMTLDNKSATAVFTGAVNKKLGTWSDAGNVDTGFVASRITLGPGLLRILPPSKSIGVIDYPSREKQRDPAVPAPKPAKSELNDSGKASVDYVLEREIKLRDVQFLQLFFPSSENVNQKEYDDKKGKLKVTYTYNYEKDSTGNFKSIGNDVSTVCNFSALDKVTTEVCDQKTKLTLSSHPKSFSLEISKKHDAQFEQKTTLVIDIGVPGILVLKDLRFLVTGIGQTTVDFGDVELCPGLFAEILNVLVSDLNKSGSGDKFKFLIFWDKRGPGAFLSIDPGLSKMGGGELKHLKIEARVAFNLDFSSGGGNRTIAMVINLGEGQAHNFGDIDWPSVPMSTFGHQFLRGMQTVELDIKPYTFRFGMALGFRARVVDQDLKLETFICIQAEAGYAFSFDGSVAKGEASLTLALRWCPTLENGVLQCVDVLAIGIIANAHAVVIGIINITLHAEIFATLLLGCSPPNRMIAHIEFSGYASITIAFVKIEAHFTVSLDKILGLDPCRHDCVGSIQQRDHDVLELAATAHASRCVTAFANAWRT